MCVQSFGELRNWSLARSRNHTRKNNKNIHIWPMLRHIKWRQTAKHYSCYGRKISKRTTAALEDMGRRNTMTEGERDKKESEKSTQNPWLSSLTCHQPDNNIPPDLHPNHHIHKQQQRNPHTPQQSLQTKNLSLEVRRCGLCFPKTLMQKFSVVVLL